MAGETPSHPVRASGFLALMRNRDYALLWTSQGVSLLGDRFHWVAISLWVYASTGSALSVSYAVIALMIGPAAVGLFAGVLADRWSRKWTMILADITRGLLVSAIPMLMFRDVRLVYLDLFLISCATAFFRPAMLATIPRTVRKGDLLPANSFFTALDTGTDVLGPVFAGLFVQKWAYAAAMYVDAATYFISAGVLVLLSTQVQLPRKTARHVRAIYGEFVEGMRYIRRDRLQAGLLALIFLGWWVSGLNSLQTPLAKGVLGLTDIQFGWFNGVWGSGLVFASIILGWYGAKFPKGRLIAVGFLAWAVTTAITGVSANAGMLFAASFWVGFANIVLFISLVTTVMEITPPEMLGRVFTARQMALAIVRVVAMLAFGVLADLVGVRQAIVGMAVLSFVGVTAGLTAFPEVYSFGTATNRRERREATARLGDRTHRLVLNLLLDSKDLAYGTQSQRLPNVATLLIVGAAWLALFFSSFPAALFATTVVAAAVAVNRFRASFEARRGSKNVRQSGMAEGRELADERRTPVTTGPTPE